MASILTSLALARLSAALAWWQASLAMSLTILDAITAYFTVIAFRAIIEK
jgi:hypothetical protein